MDKFNAYLKEQTEKEKQKDYRSRQYTIAKTETELLRLLDEGWNLARAL